MSIRISAIICTLNRASYLQKAIQSLVNQTLPEEQYEIIVVDNGSTDSTRAIVDSFRDFKNLRYMHEPKLGLSQARNTGWQIARGTYVAYLDDDAIADTEWLRRIVKAFETVQPQPGSVGGKVIPIWEVKRPPWLPKELELSLTIVDWGETATLLTEDYKFLAGTNVAYPRDTLKGLGGFSARLGRKAGSLLSNEEILLKRELNRRNLGSFYDPDICVYHHIPAERLTKRWFYRRAFWQGASDAILHHLESKQTGSKGGYLGQAMVAVSLLRAIARSLVQILLSTTSSTGMVLDKWGLYSNLGHDWMQLRIILGLKKA